ncbi:MAG: chemotaxis response regulator protein-glutamate methylesterase [Planctomycetota bacterium]
MIKVLIVDDSAVVRKVLSDELSRFHDIQVVGTAIDPYVAREKIVELEPDVITLDLEMPRMDGLTFLDKLMRSKPIPVIVVSSVAQQSSAAAIRALSLGAVAVVPKPGSQFSTPDVANDLVRAIRAASTAKVGRRTEAPSAPASIAGLSTTDKIIAIGASTGGTVAVEHMLREMPAASPGILIAQHFPPGFSAAFAEQLDKVCAVEVREATNGCELVPGLALVAPGDKHMLLERSGSRHSVRIKDGPRVHYQRPSVDVLFESVARKSGPNAIGVLLTGMGEDGARGLLQMREAGAHTIAQDEATSVVYGMPRAAADLGAAVAILPLQNIARATLAALGTATPLGLTTPAGTRSRS